ncbi:repressor LexA [Desulfitispora alkaliphila]|uniref:LexA family protein n=1 Tax=Desulfitispora alkaliphila TaxID=622674 RepID=UPI003D1C785E
MKKAEIITEMIAKAGYSKRAFAEKVGIPPTTLQSMLTRGVGKASIDNVIKVCKGLGLSIDELERRANENQSLAEVYYSCKQVPVLGSIAVGEAILAEEYIERYEYVPEHVNVDFCLRIKGDSMIGARILDGDIVCIRRQLDLENGEIGAVIINGEEATFKRFYKLNDSIILRSENPHYQDFIFSKEDMCAVKILGKAMYFISNVR